MNPANLVKCEISGYLATITLNDPENRNAMSEAMSEQFAQAVAQLKQQKDVRVAVLTGAGKAFSGGGHLEMLEAKTRVSREENERLMNVFYANFLSVRDLEIPVIAAMNGHAMGAALCLALACDIRIAVKEAKLGLNFVLLGLHPGMGATYFVPRLLGSARAAELLYTGAIVSAEDAKTLGLVNRVVEAESLGSAVQDTANLISSGGPQAIRELKASLRTAEFATLETCLKREAACQAIDYVGAEFAEGIAAAKEKRKPSFKAN